MTNEKNVRRINFKGYLMQIGSYDPERSELHRMCLNEDIDGLVDLFMGMNAISPEYLIDVIIPSLHGYAVEYARKHDLRSSTEFTVSLFNALIDEMARYGAFLLKEESHE